MLHFERHHSGIPEIDPASHKLTVHGLVARPLTFDYDALQRYPMQSRVLFLVLGQRLSQYACRGDRRDRGASWVDFQCRVDRCSLTLFVR